MTLFIVDPWVFEEGGTPSADFRRIEILETIQDVRREFVDLTPVPFLEPTHMSDLEVRNQDAFKRSPAKRQFYHWFKPWIRSAANPAPPAEFVGASLPADVHEEWKRAVSSALNFEDDTRWRDPMIFVPKDRDAVWPKVSEVTVRTPAGEGPRNLVRLEKRFDHPWYAIDLDPWRYKSAKKHPADKKPRHLPRPKVLEEMRRRDWSTALASLPRNGFNGKEWLFFIPDGSWRPDGLGREEWRDAPFGPEDELNGHVGPADQSDRVWAWDEAHKSHWDVQLEGGDYWNVGIDGFVKKS